MNIKARALTNKIRSILIPIPGEEITTGLTKSMGSFTISYEISYMNAGNYQPMPDVPRTVATIVRSSPNYVHYYDRAEITGNPLPVDFERHWDGNYEQRPSPASAYECYLKNFSGSFTFGGLSAGKYVTVIEHYYGTRIASNWSGTPPKPSSYCEVLGTLNPKTIRVTEDGVCYGETTGVEETYQCDLGYALGEGRVIKFIQKQSFIVAEGQTEKTITFGGDNFSMSQFCALLSGDQSSSGQKSGIGPWFSGTAAWRMRVYTDGGA